MSKDLSKVALIPARSGSERIKNKNIVELSGHPLLAYTIRAAIESNVFKSVVCVTDSQEYAEIAEYYGAEVPVLRPREISTSTSPDIHWVQWILYALSEMKRDFKIFSILRPTSPFRKSITITRAMETFLNSIDADSLRAVELCKQHPGKMWEINNEFMHPLLNHEINGIPWHSLQYSALPEIYIQNASLEIAWTKTLLEDSSISGKNIIPFFTKNFEGFDINREEDLILARHYSKTRVAELPEIRLSSYFNEGSR